MTKAFVIDDIDLIQNFVGQEIALSDWVEVSQERINQFAQATGDFQWIHVDVERAKQSPLGTTIAHGFLTLSLIAGMSDSALKIKERMALNYGLNKVRFTAPVPAGSRLRGRYVLKAVNRLEGGVQMVSTVTIEREGSDKPVCIAESVRNSYA
jgi:acyl dehydratase